MPPALKLARRCVLIVGWVLLAGTTAAVAQAAEPAGLLRREFLYETAPFPQCHASTLAETSSGLVAAWFGGTRESHRDVGIWLSRHLEGKWTAPVEVADGVQSAELRFPCWNPVLFQPRTGPLFLFYKVGPDPQRWWGMLKTSADAGKTWSQAQRLPEGILGPIKNKPLQLPNGDILSPSSTESTDKPSRWRVHFERSTDLGRTWTRVAPALPADTPAIEAIQPSLLLHPAGKLQAMGRSRSGRLFETWSADNGLTWSPPALATLPNPNSGTDAVTLKDGRHLLVYNHTPKGRSPLNVAVSTDGKTWQAALELETTPGEYSYPAVIQTADGLVHITYTWKRQRIQHVVLDPQKLSTTPLTDSQGPRP